MDPDAPAFGPHPAAPQPVVGRAAELDRLRERAAAARLGCGGLVFITGEAGIGKTTLALRIASEATAGGTLVLRGACYDLTATPPYGPWRELATTAEARRHLPTLEAALRDKDNDVAGQASLFDRIEQALTNLDRPTVILLDDLHWADPGSLDLVRFVARRAAAHPILLVITYRPEEVTRRHPLSPLIPLLVREAAAERIELSRLDDRSVADLVAARYALPAADAARLVAYLQRHAEGNPLYLGELLRTLESEGPLRHTASGWTLGQLDRTYVPALLRQIIDDRIDRLGDDLRLPLGIAATLGEEVPLDLWAAVGEVAEGDLWPTVERAADAHILIPSADGTRVRFRHALIRAALYEGISPPRRRLWHQRAAVALAADPLAEADAVADHFQRAGDPRAADWLIRAGERAQRAYVWLTAAERFAAAAAMLDGLPERARERGWLLYRAGRLRRFSDPAAGVDALEAAERVAIAAADPILAAYALTDRGTLRCLVGELRRGLAELERGVAAIDALPPGHAPANGDVARWVADALPAAEPVSSEPEAAESPLGGDLRRGVLVTWLASIGRFADAERIGSEFHQRIAGLPDSAAIARRFAAGDAAFGLALAASARGDPAGARAAFAAAREPAAATAHHFSVGWIAARELSLVVLPYAADQIAERRLLAEDAEAALTRAGVGVMPAGLSPRRAILPLMIVDGRWDEARRLAIEARATGTFFARQEAMAALATLAMRQGDYDLAWAQIREALPDGPRTEPGGAIYHVAIELQHVAAAIALASDDLEAAAAWTDATDRWLRWSGATRGRATLLLDRARLQLRLGDQGRARRFAGDGFRAASSPTQPLIVLTAHRLLGDLASAAGRHDEAEREFAQAAALADRCAAPYEHALTLVARASARAAIHPEQAPDLLRRARVIAATLGASPLLSRIDELGDRLRQAPAPAPPPVFAGLSARELEVLRLVAAGLTDAETASRLSISPRTVGQHLRSIYGKLGVSSRVAATRAALEHGLA